MVFPYYIDLEIRVMGAGKRPARWNMMKSTPKPVRSTNSKVGLPAYGRRLPLSDWRSYTCDMIYLTTWILVIELGILMAMVWPSSNVGNEPDSQSWIMLPSKVRTRITSPFYYILCRSFFKQKLQKQQKSNYSSDGSGHTFPSTWCEKKAMRRKFLAT